MPAPNLEDVFKLSGVPSHTFVQPVEYNKLLVALRTPGRGVIIEGPSGIGKTTAVIKALDELGLGQNVLRLSARKKEDRDFIAALPEKRDVGLVIVDDFHRLDATVQEAIADHLKVLADEERTDTKLVLVGINRVGDSLVRFAPDLNNRIDTIKFEANPDERIHELVGKGEQALNISLKIGAEIVKGSSGSFYLAQMLCHQTCLSAGVMDAQTDPKEIAISYQIVSYRVMGGLARRFLREAIKFAAGPRLRREGRAPYLHILKWLAESNEWAISLDREVARHAEQRGSAGQVVEKGYLADFLTKNPELSVLHYEPSTTILTVEDPQFVYFLRNLGWNKFAEQVGFLNIQFSNRYDFALSFAGPDRAHAKRLFALLTEGELEVFYDQNEQSRILAENIEDYLGPIYASEAAYVVVLLGPEYPKRIWTAFESEQFKNRFGQNAVIPIWFTTAPPGIFDESARVGGVTFDPSQEQEKQLVQIAELLRKKIAERAAKVTALAAEPNNE
jgi:hypothetical protein